MTWPANYAGHKRNTAVRASPSARIDRKTVKAVSRPGHFAAYAPRRAADIADQGRAAEVAEEAQPVVSPMATGLPSPSSTLRWPDQRGQIALVARRGDSLGIRAIRQV